MNRHEIVSFLENVRPQLRGPNPEEVLAKAAKEENLTPAQLEMAGQLANTAQQLHFMKKSDDRGATFQLLDVEGMVGGYLKHPEKQAAAPPAPEMEKAATVKKREGKYVLLSKDGKVLGTHESAKEAWAQEYAIQKSKERAEGEKTASVLAPDPAVSEIPLEGDRMPNMVEIARMDLGLRGGYIDLGPAENLYPEDPTAAFRKSAHVEKRTADDIDVCEQILDDATEEIRKTAYDLAGRIRREEGLSWWRIEEDAQGHGLAKEASAIKNVLSQLTGYAKIDLSWPGNHTKSALARDRHGTVGALRHVGEALGVAEGAASYLDRLKQAAETEVDEDTKKRRGGSGQGPRKKDRNKRQGQDQGPRKRDKKNAPRSGTPEPERADERGDRGRGDSRPPAFNPQLSGREKIVDMILHPSTAEESGAEMGERASEGIRVMSEGLAGGLEKVPGPGGVNRMVADLIKGVAPSTNKGQMKVDDDLEDTKSVSDLQRLMLTDPIIRDSDPDQVVSLYNTLARANPDVAQDTNLLRFALREALQYEAVPLHTYKDLSEVDEKKTKTKNLKTEMRDRQYAVPPPKEHIRNRD